VAETLRYDVVIVGGGHNGLVCAAYLAAAGMSVCVLERRAVVGGAAVTEEFHPGFRNSTASYTVSLLAPQVIRDLGLDASKVNPQGGAIALGHPLGATGAVRTATLVHGMRRAGGKYGMVTMCIGTGMGAAGLFEIIH